MSHTLVRTGEEPTPRSFDALLLAGFTGWGRPRVRGLPPRPLSPIALRPLITYPLDWFARHGATVVTVCGHASFDRLRSALGSRRGTTEIRYVEDQLPRGPGGCIRDAAVENSDSPLVIAEGSLLPAFDLADLLRAHHRSGAAMTIVAASDRRGLLRPAGVYVMERRALAYIPPRGFMDLKETLVPRLYRADELVAVHTPAEIGRRVGNLETFLLANYWMLGRMAESATSADGHTNGGRLLAHRTASIADDAVLVGDIVVGADARIEPRATIVGPTVVGAGSTIEPGALVTRTIMGEACVVAARAVVHGAFVADRARIEPGARVYRTVRTAAPDRAGWWRRDVAPSRTIPLDTAVAPVADTTESGASTCS